MSDEPEETVRLPAQDTATGPAAAAETRAIPARFGRYEVRGEIARGGMGVVYRAYDPQLDRLVALKVMLGDEYWSSDTQIDRFLREARSAARLHHANIIPVYDVGLAEGKHYFTMELIEGESLAGRLHSVGAMSLKEAAEMAHVLARAVHYAHGQGVVHRDLKPSNVLLSKDARVLITDFGLAKEMGGPQDLTRSGAIVGTPSYMAPEQAEGKSREVDARTDVYALGAVLYELLTALPPFSGEETLDILIRIREEEPRPVRMIRPDVPTDLQTVVARAMEKQKERRYPSALALAQDLERFLAGEPIVARPSRWASRMWRKAKKNRAASLLMIALGVVLLGGAAWLGGGEVRRRVLLGRATGHAEQALAAGRFDEAIASAQDAGRLAPSDEGVKTLLKRVYAEQAASAGKTDLEEYRRLGARIVALEQDRIENTSAGRAALWDGIEELRQVRSAQQAKWVAAVTRFTQAYGFWNEHRGAMDGLADLYWDRYEEADRRQDDAARAAYEGLVLQFGREKYGERMRGVRDVGVAFTLPAAFHGGEVESYLFRYERSTRPPVLAAVPCDPNTGVALAAPAPAPRDPVPLAEAAMPTEEVDEVAREADALLKAGKPLEALPLYIELNKVRAATPDAAIGQARCFGVVGDPENALGWLEVAVQRGYLDAQALTSVAEFQGLRSHPRFEALLVALRTDPRPVAPVATDPGTRTRAARVGTAFPLDGAPRNRIALPVRDQSARLHVRLPRGSYLLWICAQGDPKLAEIRYPFVVSSDMDWSDERAELPLEAEVPPGFCYIPAGPFRAGGDPLSLQFVRRGASIQRLQGFAIARYEVPSWMYVRFLNDRTNMNAGAAFSRVPRQAFHATTVSASWESWKETGVIASAWNWRPDAPVAGVSEDDVEEFASWYRRRLGEDNWRIGMPTEDQWEKAARGADGRSFPWGDVEDASFCCMADARATAGKRRTLDPYGLFPVDEGPYGVRDMAGGAREWCATNDLRSWVMKGGSWDASMSVCRIAGREPVSSDRLKETWGIRLVADRIKH